MGRFMAVALGVFCGIVAGNYLIKLIDWISVMLYTHP